MLVVTNCSVIPAKSIPRLYTSQFNNNGTTRAKTDVTELVTTKVIMKSEFIKYVQPYGIYNWPHVPSSHCRHVAPTCKSFVHQPIERLNPGNTTSEIKLNEETVKHVLLWSTSVRNGTTVTVTPQDSRMSIIMSIEDAGGDKLLGNSCQIYPSALHITVQ